MSYILEALKKSEKRRKEELASSRLHYLQPGSPAAAAEGSRRRSLLILGTIILLFALLAGTLFLSFRSGAPPVTASGQSERALPQKTLQDGPANPLKGVVPVLEGGAKTVPPPVASPAPEITLEPGPLAAENIPVPPAAAAAKAAAVPLLEELDDAFVQTVPQFTMAGHVYSEDPKLRMILINNRVIREMDIVEKDFVVEEITPDGVIMRLGEIRFRLPSD